MKKTNNSLMRRIGYSLMIASAAILPASAAINGVAVLTVPANLTVPYGGAWIPDTLGDKLSNGTTVFGHFWQSDTALGICRIDYNGSPTATKTNCSGTAKAGGQISVGTALVGGVSTTFVFVPDSSRTSAAVVRYTFNPANATLSNPLVINAPNVNTVGGGLPGGGRAVASLLDANGDMYVGYLKSGDIVKVIGPMVTTGNPAATTSVVASTSDGRGVNALVMLNNNMYVAELGGFGLSMIPDPSGIAGRVPCNAAAPCTASSLNPQPSFFPGALATNGVVLYIADMPFTTPGVIKQFNPALPQSATNPSIYSVNVPAYVSQFDGKTRSQYEGARGLAVAPNGDLYVADDPTANLVAAVLPTNQGHLWKVAAPAVPLSVASVVPATAVFNQPTTITITGTGFTLGANGISVLFGATAGTGVNCTTVNSCTLKSPSVAGAGLVPLTVTAGAQTVSAGSFDFTATGAGGNPPTISSVVPNVGQLAGGTAVTITGTNLTGVGQIVFGPAGKGTAISCPTSTTCTVLSPAFASTGTVDIQITASGGVSAIVPADHFTYATPTASLFAWGITAPKGGMTFIPNSTYNAANANPLAAGMGHMWSSDHAQGFCRQDSMTTARPVPNGFIPAQPVVTWPGSSTLHALALAVCDDGTIGSSGQAVYDPRVNAIGVVNATSGIATTIPTHYIYVPDNAVKSTAVWRLTFDPVTETIVGPPEAMVPLADVRTLKPNGMAMGPDCLNQFAVGAPGKGACDLYISDLVEPNIRKLTGANGDPRLQTIGIIGQTGDLRGANGSMGMIGTRLYISENRAASWMDVTICGFANPLCSTKPAVGITQPDNSAGFLPLPSAVFIGGVATDPVRNYVYAADSPGGANATIWRFNLTTGVVTQYLNGGVLPYAGTPESTVWISTQGVRPWNPLYPQVLAPNPPAIAGFAFAFGISVEPASGDLYITGDPTAGARSGWGSAWVSHLIQ